MVVPQQATHPLPTAHLSLQPRPSVRTFDQGTPEPLVRTLGVVVLDVLPHCSAQVGLAQGDQPAQALRPDGEQEALHEGVQVRATAGRRTGCTPLSASVFLKASV